MSLFPHPDNQSIGRVIRPYQEQSIVRLRQAFAQGARKVVLQLATGGGKTVIASEIIKLARAKNHQARVVFTVPMLNLIEQAAASFREAGTDWIGIIQGSTPTDPDAPVQVASVQTLARRSWVPDADLVIVDEAHIRSEGVLRLMRERPNARFVGLSATPWRKGMGDEWDRLIVAATSADLIREGYLCDFRVFAPDEPDMSGAKIVAGDFAEADAAAAMDKPQIVGNAVETWLARGNNQPTLAFCVNRASAARQAEAFERAGIATAYMDGMTDPIERELIKARFKAGQIKIVCSVRTMTTGVDLPVGCIVDLAPTRSEMLHVQKIGRGLRVNPGCGDADGFCIILDHAGNTGRVGFVTDIMHDDFVSGKPTEKQEREKQERLPKLCTKCTFMIPVGVKVCPSCGHEKQMPPGVETVDGSLSEVSRTGKVKAPTMAEKQRFWSMALWIDDQRKRGGKLALGLYKGKFGTWPRGLDDKAAPPDQVFFNYEKSRRIAFAKSKSKFKGSFRHV
jgi:superfamily II DNA or RNA helicase